MRAGVLAIDAGTSGTRAAVVDEEGCVEHLAARPLGICRPERGAAEQDAGEVLRATVEVARRAAHRAEEEGIELVALGRCAQRASAVLWDLARSEPSGPAGLRQDERLAARLAAAEAGLSRKLR